MSFFDIFRRKNQGSADRPDVEDTIYGDDADAVPNMQREGQSATEAAQQYSRANLPPPPPRATEQFDEGLPSVNRRRSSNFVNMVGLVVILGVGIALLLAVNRPAPERTAKQQPQRETVANTLPPLVIPEAPPPPVLAPLPPNFSPSAQSPSQSPSGITSLFGTNPDSGSGGQAPLDWTDRKRSGSILMGGSSGGGSSSPSGAGLGGMEASLPGSSTDSNARGGGALAALGGGGVGSGRSELSARLESTELRGSSASLLPNRNFLITKGTTLDCALETALDSTLPGLTTCRLTRDVYSDNGQVLLLDRGSQLVGEYQGGLRQGQARLFVLWTRAKTPNGVIVTLNSPGTDALGRSGLEGWVDNHFIERFGAAIMFSFIRDTLAIVAARQSKNTGTVIYGNNSQDATEESIGKILDSSINIPPTLFKNQGEHIQVMIARDLDFSGVYALSTGTR